MLAPLSKISVDLAYRKLTHARLAARCDLPQEVIADLTQQVLTGADLSALLDEAAARVVRTLAVGFSSIWELLPEGKRMLLRSGVGWNPGFVGQAIVEVAPNTQAAYVLVSSEPLVVEGLGDEHRFRPQPLYQQHGVVSSVNLIIRGHAGTFGVLGAHSQKVRSFTRDDIHFLQSVANVLAMAIELKRAEEALSASRRRYQNLFDSAGEIVFTCDLDGNFTSLNKAGEQIIGYTAEEALGLNIAKVIAPDFVETARKMFEPASAHGSRAVYEIEAVTKEGRRIGLEVGAQLVYENGKPVQVEAIARNVTERREVQEQLLYAQKMEAIGRLAGGVAHDFNNVLTGIAALAQLAGREVKADSPVARRLRQIQQLTDRAAALTRRLLTFSRRQKLNKVALDLNSLISDLAKILSHMIKEDIELKLLLAPDLGSIRGDPSQIEQVLMNLSVNAREAMPNGGNLIIETANVTIDATEYADSHDGPKPGPYVMLAVTDTGRGTDQATRRQNFDPFSTAKEVGNGTGLGFFAVDKVVRQHDGHIRTYSEPGGGTCFKIYLPRVDATPAKAGVMEDEGEVIEGGSETILIVEDESSVPGVLCRTLEEKGYTVFSAGNPQRAEEIFKQHNEISLLVTDVIMPGGTGLELYSRLAAISPCLKVLCISGDTDGAVTEAGALRNGIPFLQKPFLPSSLARKVREVLDEEVRLPWEDKRGTKILIVEDEEGYSNILKEFLEKKGLKVLAACENREALRLIQEERPQAILLDVLLRGPCGLDLLERLKHSHSELGVIVQSSVAFEAVGESALKLGAFHYLSKPYRLEKLEHVLWQLLSAPREHLQQYQDPPRDVGATKFVAPGSGILAECARLG